MYNRRFLTLCGGKFWSIALVASIECGNLTRNSPTRKKPSILKCPVQNRSVPRSTIITTDWVFQWLFQHSQQWSFQHGRASSQESYQIARDYNKPWKSRLEVKKLACTFLSTAFHQWKQDVISRFVWLAAILFQRLNAQLRVWNLEELSWVGLFQFDALTNAHIVRGKCESGTRFFCLHIHDDK